MGGSAATACRSCRGSRRRSRLRGGWPTVCCRRLHGKKRARQGEAARPEAGPIGGGARGGPAPSPAVAERGPDAVLVAGGDGVAGDFAVLDRVYLVDQVVHDGVLVERGEVGIHAGTELSVGPQAGQAHGGVVGEGVAVGWGEGGRGGLQGGGGAWG